MDVQQVRELAEVMADHGLTEIRIREGENFVTLRKGPLGEVAMWPTQMVPQQMAAPAVSAPAESPAAASTENLVPIKSPMVGTFYASQDPESPPFVSVGQEVDVHTPVCIIEAMKVFNEIRAEVAGTIERVLVHNEQAVEYGQTLMLVRPRG
jgi:acetyl-CoA carboxylase biotin carboxyl carrier protein